MEMINPLKNYKYNIIARTNYQSVSIKCFSLAEFKFSYNHGVN